MPHKFKMDLEQEVRPYKFDEVNKFMQTLLHKRDAAIDELDEATEKQWRVATYFL